MRCECHTGRTCISEKRFCLPNRSGWIEKLDISTLIRKGLLSPSIFLSVQLASVFIMSQRMSKPKTRVDTMEETWESLTDKELENLPKKMIVKIIFVLKRTTNVLYIKVENMFAGIAEVKTSVNPMTSTNVSFSAAVTKPLSIQWPLLPLLKASRIVKSFWSKDCLLLSNILGSNVLNW